MDGADDELLSVTAVRQYFYCKREPYYIYVVHTAEPPSETMETGKQIHIQDPFQAFLRKLQPKYMFRSPRLRSQRLGLIGSPDYVFVTKFGEIVPAEIKHSEHTQGNIGLQFRAQIVAYALILEDNYTVEGGQLIESGSSRPPTGTVVKRGAMYSVPKKKVEIIQLTDELKRAVIRGIADLREIITTGELPHVRQPWSKCTNCWYRRFCYP